MTRTKLSTILGVGLAVTWLAAMSACGSPTTPDTTPKVYTQTVSGTVSAFGTTPYTLSIPQSGNLSVTLRWSDGSIDLNLYLTPANCPQLYSCNDVLAASDSAFGASENISRSVTAGQSFTVFVDNLNLFKATSYTIDVRIQ